MTTLTRLAQADPIIGRIARAVPRSIDAMLREDIVSDIYLAIREGQLHPRDLDRVAGRFISSAFARWADKWGALSLDALMSDEGGATFIERLEDEQAIAAFERIEFPFERGR